MSLQICLLPIMSVHWLLHVCCSTVSSFCRYIHGSAGKSLAQPTSRYRMMESIVSLERGLYSCAKLQDFSCTEAERKHVRQCVRFQQHPDTSCHQVPRAAMQDAKGNSHHSDRNIRGICTIVCQRQTLGGPV